MRQGAGLLQLIVAVFGLSCAGCSGAQRYSFHQADDTHSAYYQLDTWTGAVRLVQGLTSTDVAKAVAQPTETSKLKSWGTKSIPGRGIKLAIATKWRDGMLLYRVSLSPPDSIEANRRSGQIFLIPIDEDGFELERIKVEFSGTSRIVDSAGKASSFEGVGSWPMDAQTYRSVSDVTFSWFIPW